MRGVIAGSAAREMLVRPQTELEAKWTYVAALGYRLWGADGERRGPAGEGRALLQHGGE